VDHPRHPRVTSAETVTLASFRAVDDSGDGAGLVAALDEQAELPAIERLRARVIELLAPGPGHLLLDAGCGTGDVARRLAAKVGPGGRVIGVDASTTMVGEARLRTVDPTLPVEFRRDDITSLSFTDGAFDAVCCERVFQHLDDPVAAMNQLVRVTRPGGRVAVVDSDWGMHAVNGADPALTACVIAAWAEHAVNGCVGRQLSALLADAGIVDQVVLTETITSRDPWPPSLQPFATMASNAAQHGAITADDAARWLAELTEASQHGRFFWAVTLIAVVATRPPSHAEASRSPT
jgi:SAM-dependent methyltransferase